VINLLEESHGRTPKMQQIEIWIEGCLDPMWADWLEGMEITNTINGQTKISGGVVDQAALYGLIAKLRDLGVRLLSISYEGNGFKNEHY
jgi:hypothetical protein